MVRRVHREGHTLLLMQAASGLNMTATAAVEVALYRVRTGDGSWKWGTTGETIIKPGCVYSTHTTSATTLCTRAALQRLRFQKEAGA